MVSDVHSVGLDFIPVMVLSAVNMVQYKPKHITTVLQQFAGLLSFHTCQVQRWCHNLEHIVSWCRTEIFTIDEEDFTCKDVKSVGLCGGIS